MRLPRLVSSVRPHIQPSSPLDYFATDPELILLLLRRSIPSPLSSNPSPSPRHQRTYCTPLMPSISPRGTILDSDNESDHTRDIVSRATTDAVTLPPSHHDEPARLDTVVEDFTADESETEPTHVKGKRGRKPRPKLPSTDALPDTEHTKKHKRFSWSNYPTERAFLQKQLDFILAANEHERRQKKQAAKKLFMEKFGPLGDYTTTEFENVSHQPHVKQFRRLITLADPPQLAQEPSPGCQTSQGPTNSWGP